MRRISAILITVLIVLMFSAELLARDKHSWEQVEKLKPGSSVLVALWNGDTLGGRVVGVSSTGLRLSPTYPPSAGSTPAPKIERATVKSVVLLRGPKLPDPGQWMLAGALIGGGVGVTTGAIYDATHHGVNGHWITQGLGGAGMGYLGSCTVLAGVGIAALIRHNKVVYEARVAPSSASSGDERSPMARDLGDERAPIPPLAR